MKYGKIIVNLMLIARMILFVFIAMIGIVLYESFLSSWQFLVLLFTIVIMLDIFDGKIARSLNDNTFTFFHRCADGVIDKIGNAIALTGFFYTERLSETLFFILVMRELVLLVLGCGAFVVNKKEYIKGNKFGKMYYLVLVVFVLLNFPSNVNMISTNINILLILCLISLMGMNIASHIYPLIEENIKNRLINYHVFFYSNKNF